MVSVTGSMVLESGEGGTGSPAITRGDTLPKPVQ
jgi:hypothetical protein